MKRILQYICALTAIGLIVSPLMTWAQSADDIQKQIDQHNAAIIQLDKEIEQYQTQLNATSAKKQSLQKALDQLNLNIKKTTAQISVLQNQISATQLQIQQLSGKISVAQGSIESNSAGLAQSIRALQEESSQPVVIQLLSGSGSLVDVWDDIAKLSDLQSAIKGHIDDLASSKQSFTDAKTATEAKQADLLKQQQALKTQQGSLAAQKTSQNDLLAQTKSQESSYQKLIAQKKAQESQFESALSDLKAQYQKALNPSEIPTTGNGVLSWPLDKITITQYFGNTEFAKSGAYNGKGHNGIDLAAPIGTPVHAALSGVVLATGNTDATKGCYSFGKWVFLKHANGLGTIYGHLSEIDVSAGQSVSTGQFLGYSGETGYATGPHLHFGVYVAAATQIIKLGQATKATTPCSNVTMPVPTSLSAYLNPMDYLPK